MATSLYYILKAKRKDSKYHKYNAEQKIPHMEDLIQYGFITYYLGLDPGLSDMAANTTKGGISSK